MSRLTLCISLLLAAVLAMSCATPQTHNRLVIDTAGDAQLLKMMTVSLGTQIQLGYIPEGVQLQVRQGFAAWLRTNRGPFLDANVHVMFLGPLIDTKQRIAVYYPEISIQSIDQ